MYEAQIFGLAAIESHATLYVTHPLGAEYGSAGDPLRMRGEQDLLQDGRESCCYIADQMYPKLLSFN